MDKYTYSIPHVVSATVEPVEDEEQYTELSSGIQQFVAHAGNNPNIPDQLKDNIKTAASPVVDGKPRMLHVTSFIAHEGPNSNGDAFTADGLRESVESKNLFQEGHAGIIDFMHNFDPIGYWYDAKFTKNPKNDKQGILAHGAIWAWLYPDAADKILAQQVRDGKVNVSISVLARKEDVEFKRDGESGRAITVIHKPIFTGATMLLDIEPGDFSASGFAVEDPTGVTKEELENMILKAASNIHTTEEDSMIDEIRPLLSDKLGEHEDRIVNKISEFIDSKVSDLRSTIDEKNTELEEAEARNQELTETNEDLNTQLEEKDVALQNLKETNEGLTETVASLEASVSEFEEEKGQREFEERKANRLGDVSDSIRAKLEDKPDNVRDAILTRWANQTDEEWEATKAEQALVSDAAKVEISKGGRLPNAGLDLDGKSIDNYLMN